LAVTHLSITCSAASKSVAITGLSAIASAAIPAFTDVVAIAWVLSNATTPGSLNADSGSIGTPDSGSTSVKLNGVSTLTLALGITELYDFTGTYQPTFTFFPVNAGDSGAFTVEFFTGLALHDLSNAPSGIYRTDAGGTHTANGSSATPSASNTSNLQDSLLIGAVGVNGPTGDAYTQDTDTTNGSWVTGTRSGTSGGSASTNITINSAYKITTASGAQTYNPSLGTSRQWGEILFALMAGGRMLPRPLTGMRAVHRASRW